jgi:hypothetical protein
MPTTRRRQIVRRAVMALAFVVLLPVGYVGSVSMLLIAATAFGVPPTVRGPLQAYITPFNRYTEVQERPGGYELRSLAWWSIRTGENLRGD